MAGALARPRATAGTVSRRPRSTSCGTEVAPAEAARPARPRRGRRAAGGDDGVVASPLPIGARTAMARPLPAPVAIAPAVVDRALAVTSSGALDDVREGRAQRGQHEAAQRDDDQRARRRAGGRARRRAISAPTATPTAARATLARTSTRCRHQRSSSTPANGPINEYGSSRTANPAATSAACACRSGLKSTAPARLAWKTPSPNCRGRRTANRRRKPAARARRRCPAPHAATLVGRADRDRARHRAQVQDEPGGDVGVAAPRAGLRTGRRPTAGRHAAARRSAFRPHRRLPARARRRRHRRRDAEPAEPHAGRAGPAGLARRGERARRSCSAAVRCSRTVRCASASSRPTGPGVRRGRRRRSATVDLDGDVAMIAAIARRLRVFAGHAGWSPGQLDAELAEGAWWVVARQPGRPVQRRARHDVVAGAAPPAAAAEPRLDLPGGPDAELTARVTALSADPARVTGRHCRIS